MARRAKLHLFVLDPPLRSHGKSRGVGVTSVEYEEVDDAERERIGAEAPKAAQLVAKASRGQQLLLERLARAAGPRGVRFLLRSTLETFLATTMSVDAKSAAALSDAELATLWRDAERGEEELRKIPPEPELRMFLAPELTVEVVGRRGPTPTIPDAIERDANGSRWLISKASPAQISLLERVSRGPGVQFPFASMLAKFLAATRTLDEKAAAKLSDAQVAELWRTATEC